MDELTSFLQKLSLKFKRRFIQYSVHGIKNPKWLAMFVLSRLQIVQSFVDFFSKPPLTYSYPGSSVFEQLNVDNVVERLRNDGVYQDITLPQNILQDIQNFSGQANYFGNGNPQLSFSFSEKAKVEEKYGEKFRFGYHFNPSTYCSAIKSLERDPKLWEIAAKYLLVAKPVFAGTIMWWSFVTQVMENADERIKFGQGVFHYDLEDYRCLKFMFYMTEVDFFDGPHVYIKGSHRKKKIKHQLSLIRDRADEDIIDYYGIENLLTIRGKAGFGFAEDPFVFHKGNIPTYNDRLILELKFVRNDYSANNFANKNRSML